MTMARKGWYGCDLDGTLAFYDGWHGDSHIGPPIPKMVARLKAHLARGDTVKIVTARVGGDDAEEIAFHTKRIQAYCLEHLGQALEVTCKKDYGMITLYDDRATQIIPNTGTTVEEFYLAKESGWR
jgi:hypothetical protein